MLEFDYISVYRTIGAFILAVTFTFLSLGIGISRIMGFLISSMEMTPHQASWVAPLLLLEMILGAILANPVVVVVTTGVLGAIIGVNTLVRLLKSY